MGNYIQVSRAVLLALIKDFKRQAQLGADPTVEAKANSRDLLQAAKLLEQADNVLIDVSDRSLDDDKVETWP